MIPIPKQRIEQVDKQYYDPKERALGVHQIVMPALEGTGPTQWDIFCWAVEYIGQTAIGLADDELLAHAKRLSNFLYSLHYSQPETLYGKPDRRTTS